MAGVHGVPDAWDWGEVEEDASSSMRTLVWTARVCAARRRERNVVDSSNRILNEMTGLMLD
jgi:hypothetical protein